MFKHILAAVDGSEGSTKAAHTARELAKQLGAKLTLLYVLEPIPVLPIGFVGAYTLANRQLGEAELAEIHRMLERQAEGMAPERVERIVEYGRAADTICEQAKRLDADLVFVGARGLSALDRMLVGSVSDRVVHQCERSVVVVR